MNDKLKLGLSIFAGLFLVSFLWLGFHVGWLLYDGLNDEKIKVSMGLVYSLEDVNHPREVSERLKARLDRTVSAYKDSEVKFVLVSGGITEKGKSTAVNLGRYLLSKGVPTEDILVERNGYTLTDIARNARKSMQEKELHTLAIITDYWAVMRVKTVFQNQGFLSVQAVHSDYYSWEDMGLVLHEFWAFYFSWFSD